VKKASAFTFYFLYYAAIASLGPFVVLFYQQLGFTGTQIGLLTGMSPLIMLVGAPFWTGVADATRRHRLTLSLTIAVVVVLVPILPNFKAFGSVTVLVALFSFFAAPITSFADSATMSMLAGEKEMYGRVRLGGTFGWGLIAPVAGMLIQAYGLRLAFWGYATLMFLALIASQRFVFGQLAEGTSLQGGVRTLLTDRRWVLFLALAFVGGMGFASINNFLLPYMEELKASRTTMGIALAIATLFELPVLFFADRLLKRFKARGLLVLAMIVTGVRLLLYAALNSPAGVLVVQILNGLTFPAAWVAGVSYADENAPAGMSATAQGLFGAMVSGIGAAAGGFIGGPLLESVGGQGMYLVFGMMVLVSIAIIGVVEWCLPAEQRG